MKMQSDLFSVLYLLSLYFCLVMGLKRLSRNWGMKAQIILRFLLHWNFFLKCLFCFAFVPSLLSLNEFVYSFFFYGAVDKQVVNILSYMRVQNVDFLLEDLGLGENMVPTQAKCDWRVDFKLQNRSFAGFYVSQHSFSGTADIISQKR